jgi:hypothetical protein
MYYSTAGRALEIQPDESEYLGVIESVVSGSKIPTELYHNDSRIKILSPIEFLVEAEGF